MVRRFKYDHKAEVAELAERNNLVTSPPKQRDLIAKIKSGVNEMNCVEVGITYKPGWINAPDNVLRDMTQCTIFECLEGMGYGCFIHEYAHGRFHYHGILSEVTQKKLSVIRKTFETKIGRIEIKTISFYESYLKYMTKQVCDGDHDDELDFFI